MSLGTSPTLKAAIQDHLELSVSLVQVAVTRVCGSFVSSDLAWWGKGTFIMS